MFTLFRLLIQALLLDSFSHELVYLCTNDVIAVDDEIYGDKHFAWQNFCPMISHTHPSTHHNSIENDECFSQESTVKIRYMKSAWKRSPELNKMQADTHTHTVQVKSIAKQRHREEITHSTLKVICCYISFCYITHSRYSPSQKKPNQKKRVWEREREENDVQREKPRKSRNLAVMSY